ncbi:MAG TPA: tRNA pseudouridine(13) synthase TruD [Polyangia bacterium]|nr:tRNA pseudouridine(13) synthase TruD [Polyangia bacterium]
MLRFVSSPETFTVEELAAYEPSGAGSHLFLWVEKRGLTTLDAIAQIAGALGLAARDVGYAGLKDRHALTRQWISVPGVAPERALAAPSHDGSWAILRAVPHPHKLRLGHLRGNRFQAVLEGTADPGELANLPGAVQRLAAQGLPNRFGAQRFGAGGDNAAAGLALLRGTRRERDRRRRRLLLSALQSAVFNRTLELRAAGGPLTRVLGGDVLQKTDTGGLFVTDGPAVDQPRVDAGQVVPTGPLPGGREIEPPPGSEARALEDAAIAEVGATREDFASAGRELPGARRPFVVHPGDLAWRTDDRGVHLSFELPAGVYATVLVDAILQGACT